jgi:predicted acetyltransferase
LTIERDRAAGLAAVDVPGSIRWMRVPDAVEEVAEIFERTRPTRPGEIVRPRHMLDAMIRRVEKLATPVFAAIHDGTDGADGYVVYKVDSNWIDHTAQNEVKVAELTGDGLVRVALWRFLLELDLVRAVSDGNARVDEPIHDLLSDPRQLRFKGVYDQLLLRIVDPIAALAARSYNVDGRLTIAVGETTAELIVEEGKPSVTATNAMPDITIAPRALAMAYLGDRSFRSLAQAGLAIVDRDAAVVADSMFSVAPAPQCLTLF